MAISRTVKAILFDLDGTLVKLPRIWEFFDELLIEVLNEFNILLPPKATRLAVWHSGGDFKNILMGWGVIDYDVFIHRFDQLDLAKRARMIESGEIHLFDDVKVLATLRKEFKLGLVTNTPPEIALLELNAFGLRDYFDELVMLGTIEQHIAKPLPDGFLRCLNNLDVAPEHAIMVGDSSSDIIGGNQVGMITVFIQRPDQPVLKNLEVPPDFIITDLHELKRFSSASS
jgi:HAD superfamily hydrolase (TIGR01509 family)